MYYVLRSNNDKLEAFWGLIAIAAYKTKKAAINHANTLIPTEQCKTKFIVVKATNLIEVTEVKHREIKL